MEKTLKGFDEKMYMFEKSNEAKLLEMKKALKNDFKKEKDGLSRLIQETIAEEVEGKIQDLDKKVTELQ